MNWVGYLILLIIPSVLSECLEDSDCHNGGACVRGSCRCSIGYVGDTCDQLATDYLGKYYVAYMYTTMILTLLFFLACCAKLGLMYYANRKFTMKHLTIIMMTIAMLLRTIAYGTGLDGNWKRAYNGDLFFGLTYYLFYSFVLSAYCCELFVWYELTGLVSSPRIELYTATTLHKIEMLPKLKKVFLVINGILFPNEIITRTTVSVLKNTPTASLIFAIWMIYTALVCVVETVGFFIVAGLLLRKMFRLQAISGNNEGRRIFIKVSILMIITASCLLLGLGIIIWYFFATDIWTWYALLWFARIVEFAFVGCLLLVVKPPQNGRPVAPVQNRSEEQQSSIKLSRFNSKEEKEMDTIDCSSSEAVASEESTTQDVHTTDVFP